MLHLYGVLRNAPLEIEKNKNKTTNPQKLFASLSFIILMSAYF